MRKFTSIVVTRAHMLRLRKTPRIFTWKLFLWGKFQSAAAPTLGTKCDLPPFSNRLQNNSRFLSVRPQDKALELVTFFVIVIAFEYIVNSNRWGERENKKDNCEKLLFSRNHKSCTNQFQAKNIVNFHSDIYWNYVCTRNKWSKKRELGFWKAL